MQNSPKLLNLLRILRKLIVPVAIAVWTFATAFAFWHYEIRYLLPVSRPVGAATIDPTGLPIVSIPQLTTSSGVIKLADSGHAVLLNFWNPECPCSKFMEHHVRQLLNKYSGQGVQFVTVIVNPQDNSTAEECESKWLSRGFSPSQMPYIVDVDTSICRRLGVWAAPATVILDSKGHVEYIGAYNIARFCDADDTAYAQKALAAILAGQTPKVRTLPFYGCQVITQAVTPTRV